MRDRLLAPENDYRAIIDAPAGEPLERVAVLIPIYNRADLLRRTLAGLSRQDYPPELLEVVVGDDGSEEDVGVVVAEAAARGLPVRHVRRERDGYGAGQARNLAARETDADVLVFVDADCLPAPDLVSSHAAWHRRSGDLVVIGARQHLDTSEVTADAIADGCWQPPATGSPPADWREVFYRRTARLQTGDEAFRSLVSSNFSVRAEHFRSVGGFCEDFRRWGGEDTELGWRLWSAGLFFVAEDGATIFHQIQDEDPDPGWRSKQRALNDGIIAAHIPHRFYRRHVPGDIFEVPKLSFVVVPPVPERAQPLWREFKRQKFTDWEVVYLDPTGELEAFGERLRGDPRCRVIEGSDELTAVRAARGELVVLLHGWASPDPRLAARLVRRFDARPRTSVVTVGVDAGAGAEVKRYAHEADAARLARSWDRGLPLVAGSRCREWAQVQAGAATLPDAWRAVLSVSSGVHLPGPLASMPASAPIDGFDPERDPYVSDLTAVLEDLRRHPTPQRAVPTVGRFVAKRVRKQPYRAGAPGPASAKAGPAAAAPSSGRATTDGADRAAGDREPVGVRYVGWTGHDNLGDEAMLEATRLLMPWADVQTSGDPTDLLLLGGGTLINRRIYLDWLRDKDSPRSERAVLGTGVGSPDYWGLTEKPEDWVQFLGTCAYVGVRGPRSYDTLRSWGYRGRLEICGDTALMLPRPSDTPEVADGRLVVSPLSSEGELWGGDDRRVLQAFAELIAAAKADGREVWLLACFPRDDRICLEAMREAGHPDLPYLAGYRDTTEAMRLLGSASVVVAERLHAAVLAAAAGAPFVGVEYRPKVRDFAASIGQESRVLRSDEVTAEALLSGIRDIERARDGVVQTIGADVDRYRGMLTAAAAELEGLLR